MNMLRYISNRVLFMIITVFLIAFVVFFIIQLPPGDFVSSYVARMSAQGEHFTQEMMDQMLLLSSKVRVLRGYMQEGSACVYRA